VGHFDVFVLVVPLVKELELPMIGCGRRVCALESGK
jgi:hypothetical protein